MSSTVSTTQVRTLAGETEKFTLSRKKHDEKPQKLVRTSSLDKIRRFNSFICAQQYYVLPALLAWLKSSQSVLQSAAEKTIFFFRSLIFNTFFYKLYKLEFKAKTLRLDTNPLLKISISFVALALLTQLIVCFYLLSYTHVPAGLVFLILCCFYIMHLNYKAGFHTSKQTKVFFVKQHNQ